MQKISVNWCGIFVDAYTYSTNYLLFSITIVVMSVLWAWIYEKPQVYKLIFKKSKHSNIITPVQSNEGLGNEQSDWDHGEISTTTIGKLPEVKN